MTGEARKLDAFVTLVLVTIAGSLISSGGVVRAEPAPTLTVTPSTGLVHQQSVTVTGTGYTPGDVIFLAQCESGADACDSRTAELTQADDAGAISTAVTVRRALRTDRNLAFDCVAAPGACRILAAHFVSGATGETGEILVSTPIVFDASVPAPAPPAITVSASSNLADGQIVHVHASGFVPGEQVQVFECRNGTLSARPCSTYVVVDADGSGAVDVAYLARRLLAIAEASAFDGPAPDPFDCSVPGADCALFVAPVADPVRINWVPLSFDPAAPQAPSGLTVFPLIGLRDPQVATVTGQRASQEQFFIVICHAGADVPGPPAGSCVYIEGRDADAAGNVRFEVELGTTVSGYDGLSLLPQLLDCQPPQRCELLLFSVSSQPALLLERLPFSFAAAGTAVPRFTG